MVPRIRRGEVKNGFICLPPQSRVPPALPPPPFLSAARPTFSFWSVCAFFLFRLSQFLRRHRLQQFQGLVHALGEDVAVPLERFVSFFRPRLCMLSILFRCLSLSRTLFVKLFFCFSALCAGCMVFLLLAASSCLIGLLFVCLEHEYERGREEQRRRGAGREGGGGWAWPTLASPGSQRRFYSSFTLRMP